MCEGLRMHQWQESRNLAPKGEYCAQGSSAQLKHFETNSPKREDKTIVNNQLPITSSQYLLNHQLPPMSLNSSQLFSAASKIVHKNDTVPV